ncbi:MAG: hypothetical protein KGN84_17600 [Acidobacteriota bacterium]|nr:hypothetical protein [Acidobacteriota bacterium]
MKLAIVLLSTALALSGIEPKHAEATLGEVTRVYVDVLAGGAQADQMRDMLIAAIQQSGLFAITENADRADAILRGSADDQTYTQQHDTSDSIGFNAGQASGTRNSVSIGTSSSSDRSLHAGVDQSESSHIPERHHEAFASVRLVNGEGDVIWSTTQESGGGKFHGAMADVADKVARHLVEETKRAREMALAAKQAQGAPHPVAVPKEASPR